MLLIYKHTFENGKSYIGYTSKSMDERLNEHIMDAKRESQRRFHKAIRKYGSDSITSEIVEKNIVTEEDAKRKEKEYIKKFNTFGRESNGYNMTPGGEGVQLFGKDNGMYGRNHTEESKEKMRVNYTKRSGADNGYLKSNPSEEDRKLRAIKTANTRKENGTYAPEYNGMYGRNHTEESKEKMKNTIKEKGGRTGEKNSFFGKTHTDEYKKKKSEDMKGKVWERKNCQHCDKDFGVNVLKRHENSCIKNPNRIIKKYNKK